MDRNLNSELASFLAGWLAAQDQGELQSFVLTFATDRATHYVVPNEQSHPESLGLTTFAQEMALFDLRADLTDD